ncbi:2-hydroxyacid dehydrogenase [Paenactinomyces guangxiensis]|uniref:D-glycerate dehydrogenase n=1 Tax=Paenactinomyces guangxiensis TaxID=1490290 RepID=A0A7W2A972_9BACL|nr:D-glycerate dehydrogenase [Paenactinomyces guangxiensis]MBA4495425.1 D-glycerate dehydrogenase [Paenactinomyces guangxiensis]MBH8592454.1 D-glycerate dehydrogenase [Paenactinomyces guangxiensis]
MKPKVYITRQIPEPALSKLREDCEVLMWEREDTPVPRDVLEREIARVNGLLCMLTEAVNQDLLIKAKKLRVISQMAVGYDNIDVEAATRRGIMVANTPDVLTETTADLTFALLLATARRVVESAGFLRRGEWKTWSPMLLTGQDVFGAVIGIIGLGRIGEAVARRAKGFNMKVLYHNRNRKPEAERKYGLIYADLDSLLKQSDFVCILTPYTPETRNLISERELALMKKNSVLINTARGGIVNEAALYNALKNGQIWAAGLDVFQQEPVPLENPLLSLSNVIALPHIGSASINTRVKMAKMAANHLLQGLRGERPAHLVNPEVWSADGEFL